MTATVTVRALDAQARAELADLALWPLAHRLAILDDRVCELCEYLDGMIMRRDGPEFQQYGKSVHINDRCCIAYIGADEMEWGPDGELRPTQPDFVAPPQELLEKHGHFLLDPEKYAPLRIPAQPEGRDLVVRWVPDPAAKIKRMTICWRISPYPLPGLAPGIVEIPPGQWDASIGPEWAPGDELQPEVSMFS